MQGNRFYPLFMHYKPKQLYEVVVNDTDFEKDAVAAAMFLIEEQSLQGGLKMAMERNLQKIQREEQERINVQKEKEEHLQNVAAFQEEGIVFSVPLGDVKQFEDRIAAEGIEFYRNDKLESFDVDSAPTQSYYFNKRYAAEVNVIVREIEMSKIIPNEKKSIKHLEIYVLVGVVIMIGVVFKLLNIF